MIRRFLRSAIHNATLTESIAEWPVSLRVDPLLLRAAAIAPLEVVTVVDVATGERIDTWAEAGEEGSGEVRMRSGSQRPFRKGDVVSIVAFGFLHDGQTLDHRATVVTLGGGNEIVSVLSAP